MATSTRTLLHSGLVGQYDKATAAVSPLPVKSKRPVLLESEESDTCDNDECLLVDLPTPRSSTTRVFTRQDVATSTDSPRLFLAGTDSAPAATNSTSDFAAAAAIPRPSSVAAVRVDLEELRSAMREAAGKFGRLTTHGVTLHCAVRTTCFAHASALPRMQARLQRLRCLEERLMLLELRRKIAARMRDMALLAEQIDRVRAQEQRQLLDYRINGGSAKISSKIECVYALCERLRSSLSQLQQVRLFAQQSPVLQAAMPRARCHLLAYQAAAGRQLLRAVVSTRELIRAGLRVLACTDLSRYSREDLFEISRGIEEFNTILEMIKAQQRTAVRSAIDWLPSLAEFAAPRLALEDVRPMSFSKILACLAVERSAMPTESLHNFYCANRDLLRFLRSQTADSCSAILYGMDDGGKGASSNEDEEEEAEDDGSSTEGSRRGRGGKKSPGRKDTSDYYSDELSSLQHQSERAERALGRFTDRLTRQGSPVAEFARQEMEFASGFLDCLAQSTKLLPRPQQQFQQQQVQQQRRLEESAGSTGAKKGVRWSDHSDVNVRHHVVAKYLDLVWREVDGRFACRMARLLWRRDSASAGVGAAAAVANAAASVGSSDGGADNAKRLGTCQLLDPAAMQILGYTVHFTATDTLFPPKPASMLPFLHSLALRLHLQGCHAQWESGFSRFLGLRQRPDCTQPTLLVRGARCSRLGKAFLDCLRPCLKAIGLCVAEADSWLRGSRSGGQAAAISDVLDAQLEQHLAFLCHWLFTAAAACRSFMRAVATLAANAFANDQLGVCAFLALTDLQFAGAELCSAAAAFKRLRQLPARCLRLRARLGAFADVAGALGAARTDLLSRYAERCQARARRHLADAFPTGRSDWKLQSADVEFLQPREYAPAMVASYLDPMLKAIAPLGREARLEGLGPPVAAMASAWSFVILRGKLRFNFYGAKQLQADIGCIADCLNRVCSDRELTQRLLGLEPVRELRAGIRLLRRQPVPARASGAGCVSVFPAQARPEDRPADSARSAASDAGDKQADKDVETLANKEVWLALRTDGKRKFIAICG